MIILPVIYADILLTINLIADYLVLFGTARLAGIRFERKKGLYSALIGAAYSLTVFASISPEFLSFTRFAVSVLMVFVAFGKRKLKEFLRIVFVYYICGFLFSGFMMVINSFAHADSFFVKNGIVYFEFSAMGIVASCTAAFFITEILKRIFRSREAESCSIVKIYYKEKCAVLKGFVDTGNSLYEPFSGIPVTVTDIKSVEKILPQTLINSIKSNRFNVESGLRFVPAKTVSGTVLMPVFKPEKMEIYNEKGEFEAEEVMVAVSENAPENTLIIGKNIVLKEKI